MERKGLRTYLETSEKSHWCLWSDFKIKVWSTFDWQIYCLGPTVDLGADKSPGDLGKAFTSTRVELIPP